MTAILSELGRIALFFGKVIQTALTTKGNLKSITEQIAYVSFRSLLTVLFAGVFVGAILVIQFNLMLTEFDASVLLGGLNTSAVVREVGPLIISFILAGKIGAFTAAELGTMRVTEQIDAIECLGTDPVQYLIVPRFIAIIVSSVILLMLGLIVSVVGSIFIADAVAGINPKQYLTSIPYFTSTWTIFSGIFKSAVYGTIVATVACYKGFTASGGAKGVGKAVTQAAIFTNFYIIIAQYLSNGFLTWVLDLSESIRGGF
jgi:phospholipid/cholesterol/gamma-HCH transport system permease protein